MMRNDIAIENLLWESAKRWLPVFSPEERQAGLILLRTLTRGNRVTTAGLAEAFGEPVEATEALVKHSALRRFINQDESGRIQGFWGLSVTPTRHSFTVNGRSLWTWCAQDALFMPGLLGTTARIESRDPETDEPIHLTVSPDRVEAVEPPGTVVSMGRPDTWDATSAPRLIATVCHYILFFASRASGARWQANHPEPQTVLRSLDQAVDFGRRSNAQVFGIEPARRRADVESSV